MKGKKSWNLLARDAVESARFFLDVGVEICPEFDEEEGRLWSLVVEFFEAIRLFRKLVVYLPHVDGLEKWIRVCRGATYVDEEVFVILKK